MARDLLLKCGAIRPLLSVLFVFEKAAVGSHHFVANDPLLKCGAIRPPAFVNFNAFPKLAVGRTTFYILTRRNVLKSDRLSISVRFWEGGGRITPFLANDLLLKGGAIRPPALVTFPAFPKSAVGSHMCVRMYVCTYLCTYARR